jgi:hypothetical protein
LLYTNEVGPSVFCSNRHVPLGNRIENAVVIQWWFRRDHFENHLMNNHEEPSTVNV